MLIMNAMGDLKFLIMAIIGLFIVWIAVGSRGGIGDGPFLRPPAPLSTGETYGTTRNVNVTIGQGSSFSVGGEASEEIENVGIDLRNLKGELQRIQNSADSKYKGLVEISRHSGAKQTNVDKEIIELKVSRNATEKIPITNWRLQSGVSGAGDSIDKGSYLPYSAQVNSKVFIFVEAGDKIIISTGRSPIGTSFRQNKCTGYFEQFQDFNPSIRKICPKPIDDLPNVGVGNTAERCIDFVERLPKCELYLGEVPLNVGGSCQNYITSKINYNNCVDNHKDDSDFYLGEWRVFLGRNDELWRSQKEIIKLIDHEGKVVDAITY